MFRLPGINFKILWVYEFHFVKNLSFFMGSLDLVVLLIAMFLGTISIYYFDKGPNSKCNRQQKGNDICVHRWLVCTSDAHICVITSFLGSVNMVVLFVNVFLGTISIYYCDMGPGNRCNRPQKSNDVCAPDEWN